MQTSLLSLINLGIQKTELIVLICMAIVTLLHRSSEEPSSPSVNDAYFPKTTSFLQVVRVLQVLLSVVALFIFLFFIIARKQKWIYSVYLTGYILFYFSIIYKCFVCKNDHDFTPSEMNALIQTFIQRSLILSIIKRTFPTVDSINSLQELTQILILCLDWVLSIFSFLVILSMLINTISKRFSIKPIQLLKLKKTSFLALDNCFVNRHFHRTYVYCLLFPFLFILDFFKNVFIVLPYALFCYIMNYFITAFNNIVVDFFAQQRKKNDTAIFRFISKLSLVITLSLVYFSIVIDGGYSKETESIFSYIATALILPIMIDGLIELRRGRQK